MDAPRQGYGLVQVVTGEGKGKTTSALGMAVRARGAGKKVGIVFFDKGGEHYSERLVLPAIGIDFFATGRDRIRAAGGFDFTLTDEDRAEVARGLSLVRQMFDQGYDLLILDEINSCTALGLVPVESVLALLVARPPGLEMVLTGRNAPQDIVDRADLVTVMGLVKHYFYTGVKARPGLDY
jgi:cob(I)alamin adenosyltransferase